MVVVVTVGLKETKDQPAVMEPSVLKAKVDQPVLMENVVLLDRKDQRVHPDVKVLKVPKEISDLKDQLDHHAHHQEV